MLPFDRLVHLAEEWARLRGRTDLFAQVGPKGYKPRAFPSAEIITPAEFEEKLQAAELFVTHAGTGSILAAMRAGKRVLVVPRRTELKEATTDHQFPTARHFEARGVVKAVYKDEDFDGAVDWLLKQPEPRPRGPEPSPELLARIRDFIFG